MTFAPQRPQSPYGRTQIPGSQINWDMATQPGRNIGAALASIGAVAGEAMKANKLRQQKATKLRSALSSYADDLGIPTGEIASMSLEDMEGLVMGQQMKTNFLQQKTQEQAQERAAKELAAWDEKRAQEIRKIDAEIDAAEARTDFYEQQRTGVEEERTAAKRFNEVIDDKFFDGKTALTDMANWIAAAPAGQPRTRDQYEAANPDKVMLMRFAESQEGQAWGDPDINVTQEQWSDWVLRNTDDELVTIAGKQYMRSASGGLKPVTTGTGATRQKTGDEVKDELAYARVAAGDYSDEMSGEGLWEKGTTKDAEKEGTTLIPVDYPGLAKQTTYRAAHKTLSKLGKGAHTAFKSAFVTKQKGVRLTEVDKQVFDTNGDGQLDPLEEANAKRIRSAQAVETLQQIGHEMFKHLDPTAEHPVYPKGHHLAGQKQYNVPHDIHPEKQTIVGTKRRDREQWFFTMDIDDPYEWDKKANQGKGGWVIKQTIQPPPVTTTKQVPAGGLTLPSILGGGKIATKGNVKPVTTTTQPPPRRMTEAEFFQTTHRNSKLAKAFPPIR